ncbi:hypothetical protein [Burkholderia territorii]|uniref:hypothetical protein n=1 Tax=Burkholderia territorii TaxID=1503055 RepID=UPI000AA0AC71|nr:hypothetical protein [Burkholderia territorii]
MNKAQEILAQKASNTQARRWAEGNAVTVEQDSKRNTTVYQYADGSAIKCVGSVLFELA